MSSTAESVGIILVPTDTYGFNEGKLYRLFEGVGQDIICPVQEWHPVQVIGQIAPNAVIRDE